MEDQLGGRGEDKEVHTMFLDEPPRPHGKGVMDAEVSSTVEMAAPSVPEGSEVEGNLALRASGPTHRPSRCLFSWTAPRRRRHTR
jgi:hypothetical protein